MTLITLSYTLDFKVPMDEVEHMKIYNKVLTIIIVLFFIGISAANILAKDLEFSETENRILKKVPKFSWKSLKSGKFSKDFEEYVVDQFAFRDYWVSLKSESQVLLQRKDNKGVYLGKDGYLLQKPLPLNENAIDTNIEAINSFVKENNLIITYFMPVPNSLKVLEDKLPPFANPYDQLELIKDIKEKLNFKINFVEVYEELYSHKEEYIYYKTDHHWTSLGAYYGYRTLAKVLGVTPINLEEFKIQKVTEDFYGTLFSKGNYTSAKPDSIYLFNNKKSIDYRVNYIDEDRVSNSLYELEHLGKKDKYSVFLDGNHALLTINSNVGSGKKLLVIKDSYAHSLIPFLTNHYDEIHVIDLRYFNMSIKDYIRENNLREVLILYNLMSFTEDNSIIKLKID